MKRRVLWLGAAAVLILAVLLMTTFRRGQQPFAVGKSLPAGAVAPKLISTWDMAVLLAPDGSLWAWGGAQFQLSSFGKPMMTPVPKRIGSNELWRDVAASQTAIIALRADGSLWGFGGNGSGQLAQPNPTNPVPQFVRIGRDTNWAAISAGAGHCLALRNDRSLWAWGQNDRGQVGEGSRSNQFKVTQIGEDRDWQRIEAGAFNSFALKQNGTIWGWGLDPITSGTNDSLTPQQIDPATNWVHISAGDFCVLALKSDGTLWLRGQNAHVTVSAYATGASAAFIQVGSDHDWTEVYAGQSYFFCRKADRSWWVCGQNNSGQLALRLISSVDSPRRWPAEMEPWAFAPGWGTTLLLAKDGTLWTWGARLGAPGPPKLERFINRALSFLPVNRRPFGSWNAIEDRSPHKLWELPTSVRRSLGPQDDQ